MCRGSNGGRSSTCSKQGLSGGGLSFPRLEHVAHVDLLHLLGTDSFITRKDASGKKTKQNKANKKQKTNPSLVLISWSHSKAFLRTCSFYGSLDGDGAQLGGRNCSQAAFERAHRGSDRADDNDLLRARVRGKHRKLLMYGTNFHNKRKWRFGGLLTLSDGRVV